MPLKFDDFTKLFEGKGSPAGKFNPKTFVYSDMAVRHILLEFEKKLIQNLQPAVEADAESRCLCPHYYNSDYCGYFKEGRCEHPCTA